LELQILEISVFLHREVLEIHIFLEEGCGVEVAMNWTDAGGHAVQRIMTQPVQWALRRIDFASFIPLRKVAGSRWR
jgi:hypothetical protein